MEDKRISQVEILLLQKRFKEAETVVKELLTGDAANTYYLSLLAEIYLQLDRYKQALQLIDQTIGLSPDDPQLFFIKARILIQLDQYDEAERFVRQSIELYPYYPHYFSLLGNIKLIRKQYQEALDLAEEGLRIDPEHLQSLNVRSTALLKLNKKSESFETIEGALRHDPGNAFTHANYGWGLLEKGDHAKAMQHFREALQREPGMEYAQSGMLEAIKAANPVYRLFLKYAFFMGNLRAKFQWAVIIGFYLLTRILQVAEREQPSLRPFLLPVTIVLILFAFSTWVITPLSNLFLRFNRYGQFLLSREEKRSSNITIIFFLLFLAGLACYFVRSDMRHLAVAFFGLAMMVPAARFFSDSGYLSVYRAFAIALAASGITSLVIIFREGELFNIMSLIFLVGFIGFQWTANFLAIRENNR